MQEKIPPPVAPVAPIEWLDAKPHLETEVLAARALYEIVDALARAVTEGAAPPELHEMIERQEVALTEARSAAERRQKIIGNLAPLGERMQGSSQSDRDALESTLQAGSTLRHQLEERIRETSYVARKTAAWCDNHRTFLINEVLRTQECGLYSAPGTVSTEPRPQSISASLDRTV